MTYKTLIINKGTEYQEFYGCCSFEGNLEWFSGDIPITLMSKSTDWDDIKNLYPNKDFSNIDLVTVEINIIE
jgi:hypothetical protein